MQSAAEEFRQEIWSKLRPIFDKYAKGSEQLKTCDIDTIIREVLGYTQWSDIHYVMANMFKLDTDKNGTVDFTQFGNFLFQRHLGEISLQRKHKINMSHAKEQKMTLEEFFELVNNGLCFLNVKIPHENAEKAFKKVDTDGDGLITYSQYFSYVRMSVCKPKTDPKPDPKPDPVEPDPVKPDPKPDPKPDLPKEWSSRIRIWLWMQLQKIFDHYMRTKKLPPTSENVRGLIQFIVRGLDETETQLILNLFLKHYEGKSIEFVYFFPTFIKAMAELELSRFHRNHSDKWSLCLEDFIHTLGNAYKCLEFGQVKKNILELYFKLIDTDKDGSITYAQYLNWVSKVLAVTKNRTDSYYLKEDDDGNKDAKVIEPYPYKPRKLITFKFTDTSLSGRVRQKLSELLAQFDKNKDQVFEQKQIHDALTTLLKEDYHELKYMTENVFRYDKDNDKIVTYSELINFCVEQHFGEMAIQRIHKNYCYEKGLQKLMNEKQFGMTLNNSLGYMGLKATPEEICQLFKDIDLEKSGWITYDIYFLFLKHYFGSLCNPGPIPIPVPDPHKQWLDEINKLSALERFIRIFLDQLKRIFGEHDKDKNEKFDIREIESILTKVYEMGTDEARQIQFRFFQQFLDSKASLSFEDLIRVMIEIHFINITMLRKDKDKNHKIDLNEFIDIILHGARILPVKPSTADLTEIFGLLDTNKDGFISFQRYYDFIRKYLGKYSKQLQDQKQEEKPNPGPIDPKKPENISEEEWALINALWAESKVIFDKYDTGKKGYLTYEELERCFIEVLGAQARELREIRFRKEFDVNADNKIDIKQFTQEFLQHAGVLSSERFHNQHYRKFDYSLTESQFLTMARNTYPFMEILPKYEAVLKDIYCRYMKKRGSTFLYNDFAAWREQGVAQRWTGKR